MVPGERMEVRVPFEGEPELFYRKANTFSLDPPRTIVEQMELVLQHAFRPVERFAPSRGPDLGRHRATPRLAAPHDRGA